MILHAEVSDLTGPIHCFYWAHHAIDIKSEVFRAKLRRVESKALASAYANHSHLIYGSYHTGNTTNKQKNLVINHLVVIYHIIYVLFLLIIL